MYLYISEILLLESFRLNYSMLYLNLAVKMCRIQQNIPVSLFSLFLFSSLHCDSLSSCPLFKQTEAPLSSSLLSINHCHNSAKQWERELLNTDLSAINLTSISKRRYCMPWVPEQWATHTLCFVLHMCTHCESCAVCLCVSTFSNPILKQYKSKAFFSHLLFQTDSFLLSFWTRWVAWQHKIMEDVGCAGQTSVFIEFRSHDVFSQNCPIVTGSSVIIPSFFWVKYLGHPWVIRSPMNSSWILNVRPSVQPHKSVSCNVQLHDLSFHSKWTPLWPWKARARQDLAKPKSRSQSVWKALERPKTSSAESEWNKFDQKSFTVMGNT